MNWIAASAILLVAAVAACAWMWWVIASPLAESVVLAAPFKLERSIVLRVSDRYFLELRFDRRGKSVEALRTLVGGAYGQRIETRERLADAGEPPGLPVPLVWSMRDAESGRVMASGQSNVLGSNSWSAAEVGRVLYQGDLNAGRYTFVAELVSGIPAFEPLRSRLTLSLSPKNSHSLAMRTYSLAALFIPIAVVGCIASAAIAAWKSWT